MPSVSNRQHLFMEGVAHNPQFAAKAGVPQSVGAEFVQADAAKPKKLERVKRVAVAMAQNAPRELKS